MPYLLEMITYGLMWFVIGYLAWKIGDEHHV